MVPYDYYTTTKNTHSSKYARWKQMEAPRRFCVSVTRPWLCLSHEEGEFMRIRIAIFLESSDSTVSWILFVRYLYLSLMNYICASLWFSLLGWRKNEVRMTSGTLRLLVLNLRRFLRSRSEYPWTDVWILTRSKNKSCVWVQTILLISMTHPVINSVCKLFIVARATSPLKCMVLDNFQAVESYSQTSF